MQSVKNETELAGERIAMRKDAVALTRFFYWLEKEALKTPQTEITLAQQLGKFRAMGENYTDDSFCTIAGWKGNGAIVHYHATPEECAKIEGEGVLLLDSGGQYLDGTTDITRTIWVGDSAKIPSAVKRDYTAVLKGHIALACARFPKGTRGNQLDVLARQFLWAEGMTYGHGTGHGVGQYMSVHEGIDLHQFRMQWRPTPLLPGMIITVEPGIYIEGSHGVRHENTMLVVNADFSGENGKANMPDGKPYDGPEAQGITFGPYYTFEHLTLCPILTSPILTEMLSEEERQWFNSYQQTVYQRLAPRLDEEHQAWLKEITQPI
jgi:Xaa-Pro aminopeptidase